MIYINIYDTYDIYISYTHINIYTIEYYSVIKNEILPFAATQMDLREKDILYDIIDIVESKKYNLWI